jgi:hypothetical protein
MSKRIKINFETVNGKDYKIIPPEKIAEANARIRKAMKKLKENKKK